MSSCPGRADKGAEVICREGVSLLLGQVRTDRLTAHQLERGQEPGVFPSLTSPRGFPKHCEETHHVPQAAQCKASVGGPKCREEIDCPFYVLPRHFRHFLSSFRIWQDLLPCRVSGLYYSAQQNLAAGEGSAFNIFFLFFKSSYPHNPQCECKTTHHVKK